MISSQAFERATYIYHVASHRDQDGGPGICSIQLLSAAIQEDLRRGYQPPTNNEVYDILMGQISEDDAQARFPFLNAVWNASYQ